MEPNPPQHERSSSSSLEPLANIEQALGRAINEHLFEPELADAVRHALLGGGKRIRPLLAWHACIACSGRGPEAMPACLAIEMVHAFSLVHDDLPAMDDDDLRRGKPTVHVAFGEACAILAGDALLSLAHEVLADEAIDPDRAIACSRSLSRATRSMINGQMLDLRLSAPESGPATLEDVRRMHEAKTGALIASACEMGAILAGGPRIEVDRLRAFGQTLGLLFQATDDLIDVEQSSEHAGKRTGKDERAGKQTLPSILGRQETRREVDRLSDTCTELLAEFDHRADSLAEFVAVIARRTR